MIVRTRRIRPPRFLSHHRPLGGGGTRAHPLTVAMVASPHHRRGSLLVEVAMATVMLMIGMSLTVKVLGFAAQQRRAAEHRQRAIQEAANLLERLTAFPYDQVTPQRARALTISPTSLGLLSDADLKVAIDETEPGQGRSSKRIAVRLRWRNRTGEWEAPVRLTTWIERRRTAS